MSRRNNIGRRGALGVGGLALFECVLPGGLVACAGSQAGSVASVQLDAADARDPRLLALAIAVLAPSSHNTQPWLLDLSDPECIDLYIDTRRTLPRADPLGRQLIVSHGTFIETGSIALGRHGREARVEPFPNGSEAALRGQAPVARLWVLGDQAARPDPLFDAIFTRHTNKRAYEEERTLGTRELKTIARWSQVAGCELRFVVDARQRARIATLCRDAMAIDVSDRKRNEETAAWFRFDDDELAKKGDGFGLAQGGVGGFNKWMAETFFLSRSGAADPDGSFAKKSVELTWEQASSASAFGLLTTRGNERTDQFAAGRGYVRAQLAAEALGVRTQPFSQLVQEYPAMTAPRKKLAAELGIPDGTTLQMLFRLGFAEPTLHSPRRPLAALLMHPKVRA